MHRHADSTVCGGVSLTTLIAVTVGLSCLNSSWTHVTATTCCIILKFIDSYQPTIDASHLVLCGWFKRGRPLGSPRCPGEKMYMVGSQCELLLP